LAAALLAATLTACNHPTDMEDSTWSCDCSCGVCNGTIDPQTGDCLGECVTVPGTTMACAAHNDSFGAQQACQTACNSMPSDRACGGCTTGLPLESGGNMCALHSPPRVLAVGSPTATHAIVDASRSNLFITVNSDSTTGNTTFNGDLYFEGGNCPGAACSFTLTWLKLAPLPLSFGGHSESAIQLLNNGAMAGSKNALDQFTIPPFNANVQGGGVLDGTFSSGEALAGGAIGGSIDYATGVVNIAGTFNAPDGSITIDLLLVATIENRPPIAVAGPDQSVECGSPAHLDGTASHDPDGTIQQLTWSTDFGTLTQKAVGTGATVDVSFPPGTREVTLMARDNRNGVGLDTTTIAVADTTGPVVTTSADAHGFSGRLWPPDHGYRPFDLVDCVSSVVDGCEGPLPIATAGKITRVTSDEPERGRGDGDTCADALITGDTSVKLRAERAGKGDGRVYTIHFEVSDQHGHVTASSCKVQVPHGQAGAAVDSGAAFCVGSGCGSVPGPDPACGQ
jgi:hypothetical protein